MKETTRLKLAAYVLIIISFFAGGMIGLGIGNDRSEKHFYPISEVRCEKEKIQILVFEKDGSKIWYDTDNTCPILDLKGINHANR